MASLSAVRTLVFGAVSTTGSASADLSTLCRELASSTGKIVIPQLMPSYTALVAQMTKGVLHIGWAPPLVALELEAAGTARPVLCCVRAGRAAYHAVLFTRRDSAVRTLDDLEGCRVAWVDRESAAGYVIPRLKIAAAGLDPARLFRRESFAQTHAGVAHAVMGDEADVGATYTSLDARTKLPVAAGWLEAGARTEEVHVIATAGPIPADAIVLSTRLPDDVADPLVDLIHDLAKTAAPALRSLLHADGFERVLPAHFEELRRLAAAPRSR